MRQTAASLVFRRRCILDPMRAWLCFPASLLVATIGCSNNAPLSTSMTTASGAAGTTAAGGSTGSATGGAMTTATGTAGAAITGVAGDGAPATGQAGDGEPATGQAGSTGDPSPGGGISMCGAATR